MTTTPQRYTKRPVTIEAIQWDGTASGATPIIDWIINHDHSAEYWAPGEWDHETNAAYINITTLEGNMIASRGDWIIRGVQGEFYPCKSDIFDATYQPAAEHAEGEQTGPTDAEVWAAAEALDGHSWMTDPDEGSLCACGEVLAPSLEYAGAAFSCTKGTTMTTYISPSLPGMIRNLWKSDPSERSVRTALNLAGDLIQELIDLRDQPAADHQEPPNADDPTDAEVQAAAEEAENHEQRVYDENGSPPSSSPHRTRSSAISTGWPICPRPSDPLLHPRLVPG